ncbi:MAG: amino acid racemase [Clostridia bacterium]|nr:amino acid racemase [Clostridia bacterium]
MKNKNITLGILGGLGPMAGVYFFEMLTSHTKASCDSEHIDTVISSRASTPDRTAYIMGRSKESPLEQMLTDAKKLSEYGADLIAIPCNTAHCFYDALSKELDIPIINIVGETAKHLASLNVKKVGVLATEGTVFSDAYGIECGRRGIECVYPDRNEQQIISDIIYKDIKSGAAFDKDGFDQVCESLFEQSCERIVLGCTELSLIKKVCQLDPRITDSLEVLAYSSIVSCNKTPFGFGEEFECLKETVKK